MGWRVGVPLKLAAIAGALVATTALHLVIGRIRSDRSCLWDEAVASVTGKEMRRTRKSDGRAGPERGLGAPAQNGPPLTRLRTWIGTGACAWAVLFAAPHVWWALGAPIGFPGGEASYRQFMESPWLRLYNLAVIGLCIVAVILTTKLLGAAKKGRRRPIIRAAVWVGSAILLVRGVAGLFADGSSDPVWWPTFLVGGLLFASVAAMAAAPRESSRTARGRFSETDSPPL
jgi:hypothetical protein